MRQVEKIMFAGPSGCGKTTLAKWIDSNYGIPFISGSMSDLLPQTKEESHKDILSHDPKDLYTQDYQLLSLRNKTFSNQDLYVSDRSYLDSAAYFLIKQSKSIPQCEVDQFLELCKKCICEQCELLVVLDFTPYMVREWVMEDNSKRILNKFFQAQVSSVMNFILDYWGVKWSSVQEFLSKGGFCGIFGTHYTFYNGGFQVGTLKTLYGSLNVLRIYEPGLLARKTIISKLYKLSV